MTTRKATATANPGVPPLRHAIRPHAFGRDDEFRERDLVGGMKPFLEHIKTSKDSSWVLFDRRLPAIPFEWHYNSEYELTLTLNSRGQRFVGDNISRYDDGDLVLIGPKIPHTWCSNEDVCKER